MNANESNDMPVWGHAQRLAAHRRIGRPAKPAVPHIHASPSYSGQANVRTVETFPEEVGIHERK